MKSVDRTGTLTAGPPYLQTRAKFAPQTGRHPGEERLRVPLPVLAVIGLLLAIVGIGTAVYLSVRQSMTDRANENLAAIAMLKAGQIEHWLGARRDDIQFVTRSSTFVANLRQWLQGGMRDDNLKQKLRRHLQEVAALPPYRAIGIHSASDGSLLLSVGEELRESSRDRSQALKAAAHQAPLFEDIDTVGAGSPAKVDLGYFSPVGVGEDGQALAVAHLAADPAKVLFPLLQQWPGASPSAETLLVRIEGNSVVYLNTLRHRTDAPLSFRIPLGSQELLAAQAGRGRLGALSGIDYRGVRSLGYALRVSGTPWLLLAKMDESEVYAHLNRMALFSTIITVLSVIAGLWWLIQHNRNTTSLRRLSNFYAAISKTNQAIIYSRSPHQVYRAVCDACVELAGLRLAWIGIAEPKSQRIVPVMATGPASGYLDGLVVSTNRDQPEGQGPTAIAFREGRIRICADYMTDPATAPWQARAAEFGLASSIALPLRRAGNPAGALCVYGGEKNFFDDEAIKILADMANNISFFLDHFDQEMQREKLAKETARHVAEIEDLYQNAPCGYHSLDQDGLIVRINDTELRWLGYGRDELVGRLHAFDLLTPNSREEFQRHFPAFKRSGQLNGLELDMVRKDGSILPVSLTASVVAAPNGDYLYSRTTVFDMTDIKRLETERAAHEFRLRSLSRRLVALQEEERRRLVAELHDSASPNLAAIQVILSTMRISLAVGQPREEIDASLEDALALLEDTGLGIREICTELRPPLLDYSDLIATLDGYAHQFSRRTGIAVHFNAHGKASFSREVESALFRIAQEALTNCARHAGATTIDLGLAIADGRALLTVADDGVGFRPDDLGKPGCPPGLGLINMRERAEFVGASFEINSEPGKGTRIAVRLDSAPGNLDPSSQTADAAPESEPPPIPKDAEGAMMCTSRQQ